VLDQFVTPAPAPQRPTSFFEPFFGSEDFLQFLGLQILNKISHVRGPGHRKIITEKTK
jgi:hypothetical protein